MTTQQLIENSLTLIRETLGRVERPVIGWSAGKDSQVLLYLIRQIMLDIPVIHLRGFPDPTKHAFADREIERLGLNMVELRPAGRDPIGRGDHVEVAEGYLVGGQKPFFALYYPIEAEPGHVPGPGSHCAVEKLQEPAGGFEAALDFDCVFSGLRDRDGDQVHGQLRVVDDIVESYGVLSVLPLRTWTEADIWAASELLGIPQNEARYKRGDMTANADYYPMCTECLKPTEAASVICPKTDAPVYAHGKDLDLEGLADWYRAKFTNVQRRET